MISGVRGIPGPTQGPPPGIWIGLIGCLIVASFTGCASGGPLTIDLMPDDDDLINPFADVDPMSALPYEGILYATDRAKAQADDTEEHYRNERS